MKRCYELSKLAEKKRLTLKTACYCEHPSVLDEVSGLVFSMPGSERPGLIVLLKATVMALHSFGCVVEKNLGLSPLAVSVFSWGRRGGELAFIGHYCEMPASLWDAFVTFKRTLIP